jgi:hypothetical protein
MGSGQLRYWSMCTGTQLTQTLGCTVDEQTPVDSSGYFTVAISTAADRPADATAQCGVAWLPWGPEPKGIVLLRNMLPSPDFAQAIQNAQVGTEQQTMGAYYPIGTYYATPEAFDATVGCHPSATGNAGAKTNACKPPKTLRLRLPTRYGQVRSARVYIDGRRLKTVHGKRLKRITVRRPKAARFTVRTVAVTGTHRRVTSTRTYSGCTAGRIRVRASRL